MQPQPRGSFSGEKAVRTWGGPLARLQAGADGIEQGCDLGTEGEQRDESRDGDPSEDEPVLDEALAFFSVGNVAGNERRGATKHGIDPACDVAPDLM
jgi:hypothetical protein